MEMDKNEASEESFAIEVVLPHGDKPAPCCPHGPTLLFEKLCDGAKQGRRFYACSACRDRRDCSFFQWEDDKVSEARLAAREAENQLRRPPFTQKEYCQRFLKFSSLPVGEKRFCEDCQMLLLAGEAAGHAPHRLAAVSGAQLQRPSVLLRPLDNKRSNAQFLFTDRSARFLLDTLLRLGFRKVLCVGTPRLHELIKLRNLEKQKDEEEVKSLLLDIDHRYAQFSRRGEFIHYNMFNHHFFDGEAGRALLHSFLSPGGGQKTVMVADPPFGGLVKPLASSFIQISKTWSNLQSPDQEQLPELPIMWIFPYFFEPRIQECLPSLTMLDYQVDYDNHPLYKHGKTGRKQSPVRVFTNIPAKNVILPKAEGYRFCLKCERFVWSLNKHCSKCNVCPSKDGREWKHCSACSKCVKPSWRHCAACGRCALPAHPCGDAEAKEVCFVCGRPGHRRKDCPHRHRPKAAAKKGARAPPAPPPPHLSKGGVKGKTAAARKTKRAFLSV